MDILQVLKQIMVILKEREHELDYSQIENEPNIIMALRECELLKHFMVLSMKAHVRLLDHLIRMWGHKKKHFQVGTHILNIYIEDIYFLTRLSQRGIPMVLSMPQGGKISLDDIID